MASLKMSMVFAVVMMSWAASAQTPAGPDMSCIVGLAPCKEFLTATKPPATCCGPLATAFKTQMTCLCAAFKNPAITAAANVTMDQLLKLPENCGIKVDPTACSKAPNAGPKAQAPEAASTPVAAPLPKPAPPPGKGAASSISPISGLVLVMIGFMFY